jgi:hypothetical protein
VFLQTSAPCLLILYYDLVVLRCSPLAVTNKDGDAAIRGPAKGTASMCRLLTVWLKRMLLLVLDLDSHVKASEQQTSHWS